MKFVWWCAAGYSFLCGITLIVAAILLSAILKKLWQRLIVYAAVITGGFLIYMSAMPLSLWFYAFWAISILAWLAYFSINKLKAKPYRKFITAAGFAITMAAFIIEAPSLLTPAMPQTKFEKLYIVGDSISAGIGGKIEKIWPKLLVENYNINVIDLSRAGAKVNSAIKQANKITDDNTMVLMEIGGNDCFEYTPLSNFEQDLTQIFEIMKKHNATIIMLETPTFPWDIKYSRIERKLARQYGVTMIPKRFLVSIFSTKEGTRDLAHFSEFGHQLMAKKVYTLLGQNLIQTNGMPK